MTETDTVIVFGGQHAVPPKQAIGIVGAVAAIASRDIARGTLAGVHVEHDPDTRGVILTATDSYRLLSVTVPGVALVAFDPVTLSARKLADVVKSVGKGKDILALAPDGPDYFHVFGSTAGEPDNYGSALTCPGSFANYRRLFDFTGDVWPADTDWVRVDPELWAGLLSSCATIGSYADRPKDTPTPETDFVRMSASKVTMIRGAAANGVTYRGLVMPLRK